MTLRIDQNGKLEIPESLRAALHLEPGSQVQVELDGESIVLTAAKPVPELKRVGQLLMWTGEVGPGMKDALEAMREDRTQEMGSFK
jgi:AbrB family looped-hinge helix DNA binding protein